MADSNDDLELFKKAVKSVLSDRSFKILTEEAGLALVVAERLVRWMEINDASSKSFASSVILSIRKCCTHPRPVHCHALKEKMWESYFKLCSSTQFKASWIKFIEESIGLSARPTFYQHVTRIIIEEIIKEQFPVDTGVERGSSEAMLDFKEQNALRYCGGYLLRSLKTKVSKSAHPLKESIIVCIMDLIEAGNDDSENPSTQWIDAVDRGGLIHIHDSLYYFLVALELEVRKHFHAQCVEVNDSLKQSALKGINENEDVAYYWTVISINWSDAESTELKKFLVEHYVTVRGFSFASGFMEQYKQSSKKSTQKKKALRKTLD